MKKLSEIGHEVPSTEEFACMNAAAIWNYICFTPEERRELVEQAIMQWERLRWNSMVTIMIGMPRLIEFLEENGI